MSVNLHPTNNLRARWHILMKFGMNNMPLEASRHLCFNILPPILGAGIAQWYSAGLRAGWSGVRFPGGAGNFSPHHCVQTGSGAHPASYPMGTRDSFPGVKRPEREADQSLPSSAEVKNAWSYTSTPQYAFTVLCLIKHRDKFTFYILP
jgi:hypothetical protein